MRDIFMKAGPEHYKRLAFEQLVAARDPRSAEERVRHEQQAHAFALAAHRLSREADAIKT
jgi:hypothetical protein